jgi:hypothetical protein
VRELGGERTQLAVGRRERRAAPVASHRMYECVGLLAERCGDLFTEVVGVSLRSVEAVQLRGDDGGEQLTLHPR